MMKNRKILLFLAAAALLAAPVRSAELPPLPDKPGATVKGYVECEGRGVEGVVVSDGFNVVKTDAEGRYWLKTKLSRSEFVMISTPRGYDPEVYSGFLPKFFHALDKTADKKSVQQFDFHLTRAANDDYTLLVVADEHVSGRVIDIPPGSGIPVCGGISFGGSGAFPSGGPPSAGSSSPSERAREKISCICCGSFRTA